MIIQVRPLEKIMTHKEKEETRKASLDVAHGEMIRTLLFRSCLNCAAWDHKNDKCADFDVKPPAPIIVYGCEAWEMDIPF